MKSTLSINIVLFLALAGIAFAGPKLAKDLPASNTTGLVDVIVQFKMSPSRNDEQQFGQFGETKQTYTATKAVYMTVPPSALAMIASIPNVTYISPNRKNQRFLDLTTSAVNANFAWPLGWDG